MAPAQSQPPAPASSPSPSPSPRLSIVRKAKIRRNNGPSTRCSRIASPHPPTRSHADHGDCRRLIRVMNTPSRATGVDTLDGRLDGGLPRGQLSEIIGPRTSGRMSLLLRMLASATARGELVAVVDALDMLDVASLEAAGVVLDRLLWIRGHVVINPGLCRDLNQRAMEQAAPRAHAGASGRQFRAGGARCRRGAGRRLTPSAIYDLAAAAADGRRQPDRLRARRQRTGGAQFGRSHDQAGGWGLGAGGWEFGAGTGFQR